MPVRIIAGRAGSGKSLRTFNHITAALRACPLGPPIYWITPRQATFSTERWLTTASGLPAFSRCRILSFEGLADEVLAKTSGHARALLSAPARLALIGHLLRAHAPALRHFNPAQGQPPPRGLAAEVMAAFDEISRAGAADALRTLLDTTQDLDPTLRAKLADLLHLKSAYDAHLGPARFDKDSRMEHVLAQLHRAPHLRHATFHIDGFLDLLDFERRMIAALAESAPSIEINFTLPHDCPELVRFDGLPPDDSPFRRALHAHRALRILLRDRQVPVEVLPLPQAPRFASPALAALECTLAGVATPIPPLTADVRLIESANPRAEANAAARAIRELVDGGLRFRDIIVLARDLAPYENHLPAAFADHGITLFRDERRDASRHPLLRLVRALLRLALAGCNTHDLIALAKSGLVGCTTADACALDDAARTRGLREDTWPLPLPPLPSVPACAEPLRARLIAAVSPWIAATRAPAGLTFAAAATTLLATLEALRVRQALIAWMADDAAAGRLESQAEHRAVWTLLVDFLDEAVELLGPTTVTPADLEQIFAAGLDALDLGLIPPTTDAVLVGPADRTRPGHARAAIVLGLSDGLFPLSATPLGLLTDADRAALPSTVPPLDASAEQRQLDERGLAYLALTRASHRLILTRPLATDAGEPLAESPFWQAARAALRLEPTPDPLTPSTPRQLTATLLRWARDPALHADPAWRSAYATFAALPEVPALAAPWASLSRTNAAALSPVTARRLFPDNLTLSDRTLESYAACPFSHFVNHTLGARIPPAPPPSTNKGHITAVLRTALDRLCDGLIRQRRNWDKLSDEELPPLIARHADAALARTIADLTHDGSPDAARLPARDRHALLRLRTLIDDIVASHRAAADRTAFTPHSPHTAPGQATLPLTLPSGRRITLTTHIDRIDTSHDGLGSGGTIALAWRYDLESANIPLWHMRHGISIRLLITLLVLRDLLPNVAPAGAVGVSLGRPIKPARNLDDWRKAPLYRDLPTVARRRRAFGLINLQHAPLLERDVPEGKASALFPFRNLARGAGISGTAQGALQPADFELLLAQAERWLAELAECLLDGNIAIHPYRLNQRTIACATCNCAAACRFDPRSGHDRHRDLGPQSVADLLAPGGRATDA